MTDLSKKHCQPVSKETPPLSKSEVERLLREVSGYGADSEQRRISRTYKFKNYYETIAFVNAVAWVAHREDHHPDLEVSYNSCRVTYSTHTVGGLSENDFISAARVSAILEG